MCGEALAAEHGAVDPQPIGGQGDPGGVIEGRALKTEQPAYVTADHDPAICAEAVALHVLIDLQDISNKGRAGVVAQLRPGAVEAAADMGADQADGASLAGADGGEPAAEEHTPTNLQPISDQGRSRCAGSPRRTGGCRRCGHPSGGPHHRAGGPHWRRCGR